MCRKALWISYVGVCLLFTVVGCAAVDKAVSNYKECRGDSVCMAEMQKASEASYVVTKAAASGFPVPSVPEILAVVVSNIVSFGYGVFHGKKKG